MGRRYGYGYAIYGWAVLVFVVSEVLSRALGIRFADETLGSLYQYLDPVILRDDLLAGVYHLHSQPPLFNLGLGLALKVFPSSYGAALSVLFGAMALLLLLGTARLMRALGVSDGTNGFVLLLFALSPNFLVYRNWLFYTLPVALLLVLSALALLRGRYLLFGVLACVLMLTRSVFHPLWLVGVAAVVVLWTARGSCSPSRRRFLVSVAVALLVTNAWFLKNQIVVGSYSASTWLGMSLSKRWPLSQREMAALEAEGVLPPYWHRRSFQEPRELEPFGFFQSASDEALHPALGAPYKSNGEPNFNHHDYVAIANGMLAGDLSLMWRFPGRYAQRVATALLLYLQPGPNSVHFLVDYDFERVHRYRDAITRYLFFGGGFERPIRMFAPPLNSMVVIFPLLLVVGVWQLRGSHRATAAFMLVTVVWVTAVTCLVEIGENDRMRWEVEPFLVAWLGLAIDALRGRWRRATSSEAGKA